MSAPKRFRLTGKTFTEQNWNGDCDPDERYVLSFNETDGGPNGIGLQVSKDCFDEFQVGRVYTVMFTPVE